MSKLAEIARQRREDVAAAKEAAPGVPAQSAAKRGLALNLAEALRRQPPVQRLGGPAKLHVAAEFKKASPSKGDMAPDNVTVSDQVEQYIKAGASIVSVLTEPKWFKGSLEDMESARAKAEELAAKFNEPRSLILRKDFVVDEYQIHEAILHGADTLLLIVAILTDDELCRFISVSRELGMEPLVEAANEAEMKRALDQGAKVIGINNRDLTTFTLDLATTTRCAALVPPGSDVAVLSLSGMKSREDVVPYESIPCIRGVLVGEALMRNPNPAMEVRRLVVDTAPKMALTRAKICGVCRPEDALAACRAGASFVGVIFAEKSPRKVSVEEAKAVASALRGFCESKHQWEAAAIGKKAKVDALIAGREMLERAASRGPLLVGVFKDQPVDFVNQVSSEVGLDLVQLHGNESNEFIEQCSLPVVKVLHVPANTLAENSEALISQCPSGASAVLLDTALQAGQTSGGTGKAFAWALAKPLSALGYAVFVAGGLNVDNVSKAIEEAGSPFAVDCSSGVQVEGEPRKKNAKLVGEFVAACKKKI